MKSEGLKTTLLKLARRNFNSTWVSREINRRNQRKYAEAVFKLGPKWLLATQVQKS